jgi:hypothetical protein
MSINWAGVAGNLSSITTALSNLNITGTTANSILSAVGLASNPNENEELQICAQILMFANNPAMVQALATKLATEIGIPQSAAAVAMTLAQPGIDVTAKVLQIETLIKQGG